MIYAIPHFLFQTMYSRRIQKRRLKFEDNDEKLKLKKTRVNLVGQLQNNLSQSLLMSGNAAAKGSGLGDH